MKFVRFFLLQVVVLGTLGFAMWVAYLSVRSGHFAIASDEPQAWLFALFLIACFLLFVGAPLQWLFRKSPWRAVRYLVGLISGPLGVVLALYLFSHYPFGFEYYFHREILLHTIFSFIGLCFAFNVTRLWPNNSFKPTAGVGLV